jgi:hypothetical protein
MMLRITLEANLASIFCPIVTVAFGRAKIKYALTLRKDP